MIKHFVISLPEYIHTQIKERCHFYDIPIQEVASSLLVRFVEGDFDEYFNIKSIEIEEIDKNK